jgi:dihydrofolate reductase
MKTQYYTATSLDGFIATEDDSLDWLFSLGDVGETSYPEFIAGVGALAMGSATYEWMLRHADRIAADMGAPWPYAQPTWVFSTRALPGVAGADIRFVHGDVRPVHARMRAAAGGKNLWIVGGGDLAGQFFDVGLLDEMIVQIGSVTLARGKPLFPRRLVDAPLRLLSVRQVGTGFAELRYAVGGARPNDADATTGADATTDADATTPSVSRLGTGESAAPDAEEAAFWGQLEYRVCAEVEGLPDRALRRYWCDGFEPLEYRLADAPPQILGRVWLDQEAWTFVLLLPDTVADGATIPWASLLPAPGMTEWLSFDVEARELVLEPAAAVPDDAPVPDDA